MPSQISTIGSQALSEAYKEAPTVKETDLWRFNAQYSRSIPTHLLQLQAFWLGPSSQPEGYVLQKSVPLVKPLGNLSVRIVLLMEQQLLLLPRFIAWIVERSNLPHLELMSRNPHL
ncbi:MAG: DUF5357 domain-containing protein [Leptolyngbyaceae cyanobacterium CRU_2_3]|nr:DUF5357 domain-containing protein [Leptolyngbyaceae cyanobacterium CRU_2_3]